MRFSLHAPIKFVLATILVASASVWGIGMRHDVDEQEYLALATNSEGYAAGLYPSFRSVVAVGVPDRRSGFDVVGTGTLVSPNFILTAAHVILSERRNQDFEPNLRVRFGKSAAEDYEEYRVVEVFTPLPAEEMRALQGSIRFSEKQVVRAEFHDLALLQLDRVVPDVHPMAWDESEEELLGKLIYIAGYGDSAKGDNAKERNWTKAELRRAAENVIDREIRLDPFTKKPEGGLILFDFDNGKNDRNSLNAKSRVWERIFGGGRSSPTPTQLEGASYPGDSGGPAFAKVDDQWRIVGVSGYGTGFPPDKRRTSIQYGDILVYTRVQSHAAWIRGIVGPPPGKFVPDESEVVPGEGGVPKEGEEEVPNQGVQPVGEMLVGTPRAEVSAPDPVPLAEVGDAEPQSERKRIRSRDD